MTSPSVSQILSKCNRFVSKAQMNSVVLLGLVLLCTTTQAVDIYKLYGHGLRKRNDAFRPNLKDIIHVYGQHSTDAKRAKPGCPPIKPFSCPGFADVCLPLQYICDGSPDCPDGYDEDIKVCTAAVRPPVDEIVAFLKHLIQQNGIEFLGKLFGEKALAALEPVGGLEKVAIALSESKTVDDFGRVLHLLTSDVDHMRNVLSAVEEGNLEMLRDMGIKESAIGDVKFFLDKLVETGFLYRN